MAQDVARPMIRRLTAALRQNLRAQPPNAMPTAYSSATAQVRANITRLSKEAPMHITKARTAAKAAFRRKK